jgi:hypothetical protein
VHLLGSVPGDGFVGSGLVVLDPVVLRALSEDDGVGDLVEEEALVLQCAEAAFA